jgi:cell division protein FtsI/penicillin-binding protein 2
MAYAVPKEIENIRDTTDSLSQILGIEKYDLMTKLDKPEDAYEVLKHRLSEEEVKKISESGLKGVHLVDENYRYYPSNELASQLLGFVGWKENTFSGRYGLEANYEKTLKGEEGSIFQSRDTGGRWIAIGKREISEAVNGDNLVLTVDHIVQYESEKLLESAIERYGAEGGSIIVMEVSTGRILALANNPTFNPNNYSEVEDMAVFRNPAVSDAYECGSVFKTFTLASGLDSNKINPETTYSDTGSVKEAGYTVRNSDMKSYGTQTISQVLEKSLNTGAIFVEKQVGNKNFSDYVKRFGFGEQSGIDLIGESPGDIGNLKNLKSNIQFFTASFGQGITVTPIQLISAYNAIANGGMLMKPQIVEKIIHEDESEEIIQPQEIRRVISQRAAGQATDLLKNVVAIGHGKRAGVPGYLVGGKTGTAQVASSDAKGYDENKTIGSFVGFAPLNNPRFTILIKMNNPKNVQWAESSAAPTFGELMKFLLDYYNVEPTEEYTQTDLDLFNQAHNLKDSFLKREENNLVPSDNQIQDKIIKEPKNKKKDEKRRT